MKKMRKNNKGFTLVELIIVVAIIAILTVAVAPQYLKYVEKSREASDLNAIEEVISVMSVAAADPANTGVSDGTVSVSVSSGTLALAEGSGEDSTGLVTLVNGMIDMPKIQSTDGQAVTMTINVDLDGKGVSVDTTSGDPLAALRS